MGPGYRRIVLGLHRWSGLAGGVFALVLCLTGLPLIFADEIAALGADRPARQVAPPATTAPLSYTAIADTVHRTWPGATLRYLGPGETGERFATFEDTAGAWHSLSLDKTSGALRRDQTLGTGMMAWLLALHGQLLAGAIGQWLVTAIGIVIGVCLITGVLIHAPFLPRAGPLAPRAGAGPRLAWLDRHNLVGLCLASWALLITLTGLLLALAGPIHHAWLSDTLAAAARHDDAAAPVAPRDAPVHPDRAIAIAEQRWPDSRLDFLALPGSRFATPGGDGVYLVGRAGPGVLTHRMLWVSARKHDDVKALPLGLAMQLLMSAQPLHLGDFGGLALKLVWAMLDLLLVTVTASGLWLWWHRLASARHRLHATSLARAP